MFKELYRKYESSCLDPTATASYMQMLYLVFYKLIRELFPNSKNIKPYLQNNEHKDFLLPHLFYAYHFCEEENDTLYCHPEPNAFINSSNYLSSLSRLGTYASLHFPSFYKGLIKYCGLPFIKCNRKQKGLPEKYWNF